MSTEPTNQPKPAVRKAAPKIEKGVLVQCTKGKNLGAIGVVYDVTPAEDGESETLLQNYTQRPGGPVEYWTAEISEVAVVTGMPKLRLRKHFPGDKPVESAQQQDQAIRPAPMPRGVTGATSLDEADTLALEQSKTQPAP